ncbi:hypothetical protein BE221DRAFT_164585, partial [Ostreococcus tauri]
CDGGVDAICAPSMANKQAYADAHGYDFIVDADAIDRSAPTRSWSKLLAMRKHLPRYDFLLYVDVDAVVMNPETGLEDIVDFDYDQVLAVDSNGVHCGVWLVRNTPWTLWFLDELWARERVFEDKRRALHHLYASTRGREVTKRPIYPNANTVRARTKIVHACAFDSQPWFYETGDFIIPSRGTQRDGEVCRVRALLRARAGVDARQRDGRRRRRRCAPAERVDVSHEER